MKAVVLTWVLSLLFLVACTSKLEPAPEPEPGPGPATEQVTPVTAAESTAMAVPSPTADQYAPQRQEMVKNGVIDWGITDEAVIEVMGVVPRHAFVPEEVLSLAYNNHPLPIGYGQTISQPYIVALMTESVELSPSDRVLEIGTGSGYQAAVLSRLVDQVYSVEIIEPLAQRAEAALESVGYDNVTVRHDDGYFGWQEHAPYDAIVVTAAPDHIPQPLVEQLEIGGRMVIPVGPVGGFQTLWLLTRTSEEEVQTRNLGGVRFVPFTREDSTSED
ncbi:MAG TPA: protein-L-isoaspartate(D-aspartate) O-methyltransferase [Anaerolineae bacterium]|jgi:protein-L-isoaspartate(D-aspartate) O-methyltransferase|nr:protein-L-isoaspartate(D-aspartate) O-methyltransferase [Anaerolineae bacterium]